MKRAIKETEYNQLAKINKNCLDFENIPKENVVDIFDWWLVMRPTNNTQRTEAHGKKVKEHLLLVPKLDSTHELYLASEQEGSELVMLLGDYSKDGYSFEMRALKDRSIKKLHIHLLKLE